MGDLTETLDQLRAVAATKEATAKLKQLDEMAAALRQGIEDGDLNEQQVISGLLGWLEEALGLASEMAATASKKETLAVGRALKLERQLAETGKTATPDDPAEAYVADLLRPRRKATETAATKELRAEGGVGPYVADVLEGRV